MALLGDWCPLVLLEKSLWLIQNMDLKKVWGVGGAEEEEEEREIWELCIPYLL